MSSDLIPTSKNVIQHIGRLANQYASQNVFTDYQERIAHNTFRRAVSDLDVFSEYLSNMGLVFNGPILASSPTQFEGVTHGLVDGFVRWMLQKGYSIGSINVRLSTVKTYCRLACKAGIIPTSELALINMVQGYRHVEGRNVDQVRDITRLGSKKEVPVSISREQAEEIKKQPDTPQGRRDALLMCLLLDHGLRCGEIARLVPASINIVEGTLVFYRQKVDKTQIHELTRDTRNAAMRYFDMYTPSEKLLAGSRKGGNLEGVMSERAINDRVIVLGEVVGLVGLSPHDCRHYWSTAAIRGGTDIKSLQDAGGWNSPAMPLRYAESSKIANKGVKLG